MDIPLPALRPRREAVRAILLLFWPLVRMAAWLPLSLTAVVLYREVVLWLPGRLLRVTAWKQLSGLLASAAGGKKWSLAGHGLSCVVTAVWERRLYKSADVQEAVLRCMIIRFLFGAGRTILTCSWGTARPLEPDRQWSLSSDSWCRDSVHGNSCSFGFLCCCARWLPPLFVWFFCLGSAPGVAWVWVCGCGARWGRIAGWYLDLIR